MNTKILPKLLCLFFLVLTFSCSKTEENVPLTNPTAQITVDKLVRKASLRNQEIPFKIIDEDGNDVTSQATFFVNGTEIEGSVYSNATVGTYEVYAVYMSNGVEVTTNTESFDIIIPKKKILVEDYTGTWCGFCPRVIGAIQEMDAQVTSHKVVPIAIHETANSFPDPMHFDQIQSLKDAFGINGLPAARINRTSNWNSPYSTSDVTGLVDQDTNLALAINSQLEGSSLTVSVDVVYENGSSAGDRLAIYLLEDGIINDQINYLNEDNTSPFFGLGNPIPNFEHNHVLRNSLTGLFGDDIPSTSALTEYNSTVSFAVPSNYVVDKLSIVAFVVSDDNTTKNVQIAHINEDKSYE